LHPLLIPSLTGFYLSLLGASGWNWSLINPRAGKTAASALPLRVGLVFLCEALFLLGVLVLAGGDVGLCYWGLDVISFHGWLASSATELN